MNTNLTVANEEFTGVRTVVETPLAFDEVLSRLRGLMGKATLQEAVALAKTPISESDYVRQVTELAGDCSFMMYAQLDYSDLLPKFGIKKRAVRLIFGNPVIAESMIRYDMTAALFAPVELLVTEAEDGKGTCVLYVRPSSLIVVEDNPPLLAAVQVLDDKMHTLITRATTA